MATARITSGFGYAPGYGKVTKPKKATAWGGGLGNSIQTSLQRPTFTPTAPVVAAPVAAAAAPAAAPAPASQPTPDPRDSIFSGGVNGLLFSNKNQRDDLTHQGEQATQDFNTMLARMAENRANDLLAQNYGANKQGLFYSGQLGKRRDTVEKGYKQQEDDSRTSYSRANDARAAALDRLGTIVADPNSPLGYSATGQAGLDLSSLFGEAVGRQRAADAGGGGDLAAARELGPTADVPAAAAAAEPPPPAATSSSPQGSPVAIKIAASAKHGGAKWVFHRAANGEWMPIRPA